MFIAAGDREQLSCAEAIDDVGSAQATLLCDSQTCVCALSDPHTIWTAWRRRSGAGDVWGAMIWKTTADFQDARRRLAQGCDSLRRAIMRTTTQRLPAVAEPRRAFRLSITSQCSKDSFRNSDCLYFYNAMLFFDFDSILSFLLILLPLHYYVCITALRQDSGADDLSATTFDGISHAFVQTDTELHYFRDVSHQEILLSSISEMGERFDSKKPPRNVMIFETDVTDFGESAIGVPVPRKIYVINPTNSKIIFTAITSQAINFHCSFFEKKVLEPKQRTSFDILFLPTKEGVVEDLVLVHSSVGKFLHNVLGRAVSNPYRLRPLFGIRLPLNATYRAPLIIHNPHSQVLKVSEVLSSDPNVHVELSEEINGGLPRLSADSGLWKIAPYDTKAIAHINIMGSLERNSTSFVYVKMRLKTKNGLGDREHNFTLVLPLEVQVTRRRGIFSTDNTLDFGLIKEGERSKQVTLSVYSNLEKGVDIESIYVAKSINSQHGIYLQFAAKPPISIKCGARNQPGVKVAVATINIDSSFSSQKDDGYSKYNDKLYSKKGTIVAESRGGNYNVSVPYEALIYRGELLHNPEDVAFHDKLKPVINRAVVLTNGFPFGVAIRNVTMAENGKQHFEAKLVSPIVAMSPGQSLPVLLLKYIRQASNNFTTHCTLHTNVTSFDIPILVFDGRIEIKLSSLSQKNLDFGTVTTGERRTIFMVLENPNPVPSRLKFEHPLQKVTSLTLSQTSGNSNPNNELKMTTKFTSGWIPGQDFVLGARSYVVFNYTVIAPPINNDAGIEEPYSSTFTIRTDFGDYSLPVSFQVSQNSLAAIPTMVTFKDCFIGTVHSTNLKIYSTFSEKLSISRLTVANNDPRFLFSKWPDESHNEMPTIQSRRASKLTKLMFVPEAICHADTSNNDCYVGIPLDTPDGQWFAYGLKLPQNLAEIDSYLYGRLRKKWNALPTHFVNTTIILDTPKVKNFEIPVQAELTWPRLLSHSVVHFPVTAVGNFSIVNLTLHNPSTQPVIVQLLPLVIYPDAESMLEYFRGEFPAPLTEPIEMNETLMFSLRDTELFTLKPGSPVPKLREELEEVVGTQVPRFTLSMVLKPSMKIRVRLGFLPSDYNLRSSLLLIRNNLTGLEPVVLYGQGAEIRMEIDHKSARSNHALLFDIQSNHLADCHNPKRLMHKLPTTLTVKRTFSVQNTGKVTFSVMNMSINNVPCENRGFRILNCQPFRLEPGQSTQLDVAYTPDFLMSFNEASLQVYMHMNGTPWVFDVAAQIPRHMLQMCHAALPRPPFEGVMYYSCLVALLFCLICVVACSYLEGDRIITCAIRQPFVQETKVFDLNSTPANSVSGGESKSNSADQKATNQVKAPEKPKSLRALIPKRVQYKDYVAIGADASWPVRTFGYTINYVLWIFSHVWLMVRGDHNDSNNRRNQESGPNKSHKFARKKKNANGGSMQQTAPGEALSISTIPNPKRLSMTSADESSAEGPQNAKIGQKSRKAFVKETGKKNGLQVQDVLDFMDNNKDRSEMELRLRRTLAVIDDEKGLKNGLKPNENHAKTSTKKSPKAPKPEQPNKKQVKDGKSVNNNLNKESNNILANQSKSETGKTSENLLLMRSASTLSSQSQSSTSSSTKQKKKQKNSQKNSTPFSQSANSTVSQTSSLSVTKEEESETSIPKKTEQVDKHHLMPPVVHNTISNSDEEGLSAGGLSDGSGVPEWAESTLPLTGNLDDDFDVLASNSAALFHENSSRTGSPVTTSSDGSLSSSSYAPTTQYAAKGGPGTHLAPIGGEHSDQQKMAKRKKKSARQAMEDPEVKRYIGQLTKDYKERLKQALANGRPLDQALIRGEVPTVLQPPPSTLNHTANSWNWLMDSEDAIPQPNLISEKPPQKTNAASKWSGSTLSPLSTTSSIQENTCLKATSSKTQDLKHGQNSNYDFTFDSLYSAGDPIWKPIFEEPGSYWPAILPGLAEEDNEETLQQCKSKKE